MEVTQLLCVAVDMLVLLVHLQVFESTQGSMTNLAWRCRDLGHVVTELQSSDCVLSGEETKFETLKVVSSSGFMSNCF